MKAFVTGGTGFIGSHLVEALLATGQWEVRCLVRSRLKWLEGLNITPIRGTLFDTNLIRDAVRDVDTVFHLGALTRAPTWDALYRENVEATLNLLGVLKAVNPTVKKIVIASSLAVVGRAQASKADETTPLHPITYYGRSKAAMEGALDKENVDGRSLTQELPVVIIRPPSVYGPREKDLFTFFRIVSKGLCPIVRGIGALSLVHVHDLVHGMLLAADNETAAGNTYFIGSDEDVSWDQLHMAVTTVLDRTALKLPIPKWVVRPVGFVSELAGRITGTYPPMNREKAAEIRWAVKACSSEKAHRDLGYRQTVSLIDGVRDTLSWYQEQGTIR